MALIHRIPQITSITYSALVSLVNSNGLVPGNYYQITDYKAIYIQPQTSIVMGDAVNPSNVIPLIVLATSNSTLDSTASAVSTIQYPDADKWKIKYDLNLPVIVQQFSGIDWGSVSSTQNTNIQTLLLNDFGYTVTGPVSNTQTFVDGQFASDFGLSVTDAELAIVQQYNNDSFSPALPTLTTPVTTYNTKYAWADSTSRGVIYDLEDESGNRAPFDFKNIRFRRYKSKSYGGTLFETWINGLYYEYALGPNATTADFKDVFLFTQLSGSSVIDFSSIPATTDRTLFDNKINPFVAQNSVAGTNFLSRFLNNIVIYQDIGSSCVSNSFGENCREMTFGLTFNNNTIGSSCFNNFVNQSFTNNRIGNQWTDSTIDTGANNNVLFDSVVSLHTGENFFENTCGNNFFANIFANNCSDNVFGSGASSNTFGSSSTGNRIGVGFQNNTLGSAFSQNNIGHYCLNNTIGPNFFNNTVGHDFQHNTSTTNVDYCEFGNNVKNITFPTATEFKYTRIRSGVSFLNMASATWMSVFGSYPTSAEILVQEDGFTKAIYLGANGTYQVVDPTA